MWGHIQKLPGMVIFVIDCCCPLQSSLLPSLFSGSSIRTLLEALLELTCWPCIQDGHWFSWIFRISWKWCSYGCDSILGSMVPNQMCGGPQPWFQCQKLLLFLLIDEQQSQTLHRYVTFSGLPLNFIGVYHMWGLNLPAITKVVLHWSLLMIEWTLSTFLSVQPVVGQPEHSQTSSEISRCLNGRYQSLLSLGHCHQIFFEHFMFVQCSFPTSVADM